MISMILELAFSGILPYIAPLIFVLSAFAVGGDLIDLIRYSFLGSYGRKRRRT